MRKVLIVIVIVLILTNALTGYLLYINNDLVQMQQNEMVVTDIELSEAETKIVLLSEDNEALNLSINEDYTANETHEKTKQLNSELVTKIMELERDIDVLEARLLDYSNFDIDEELKDSVNLTFGLVLYEDKYLKLRQSEESVRASFGDAVTEEIALVGETPFKEGTKSKVASYKDFTLVYISDEYGENFTVFTILAETDDVTTVQGIGIGDTVDELFEVYPMAYDRYNKTDTYIDLYDNDMEIGECLTFEIDNGIIIGFNSYEFIP